MDIELMRFAHKLSSFRQWPACVVSAAALAVAPRMAVAEDAVQADTHQSLTVALRISMNGKFTDNLDLSRLKKRSEWITEVSPGVRLTIDSGRVKTYLDYAVAQIDHANHSKPSDSRNLLNSFGSVEVIDNLAFLDFSGSISQQTVSALGVQSFDDTGIIQNRAEVSTYHFSPYIRGQWGDLAQYEARYSRTVTDTDSQLASASTVTDSVLKLRSSETLGDFGWMADLGRQTATYSQGRATESDSINVGLIYRHSPQLQFLAKGGTESSNYTTPEKQRYATHAIGVTWLPSELTSFSITRSHQSFGQGHSVLLTHRSGRTVWKLSDTKDLSITAQPASLGSMYDLLFTQFASIEPDPTARALMVENFLQTNGISPTASATNGFLTAAVSVQRRQELSFALLGLRDTITFIASRSESSRLDTLSDSVDDLTNFGNVRQQGFSIQLAHRLTPDYSLGALFSQQRTVGASGSQGTLLRSLDVILSGKVGKRSTLSLGAHHAVMESDTTPYTESAVSGNINVQF